MAMRLVSLAGHEAGLVLTVAQIFQHPRLGDMASNAVPLQKVELPDLLILLMPRTI